MADAPFRVTLTELEFSVPTLLANVRGAIHFVREAMPGQEGLIENDELREIALRLAKVEAKINFAMGTIDEDDLKLALESELPRG